MKSLVGFHSLFDLHDFETLFLSSTHRANCSKTAQKYDAYRDSVAIRILTDIRANLVDEAPPLFEFMFKAVFGNRTVKIRRGGVAGEIHYRSPLTFRFARF